MADNKTGKPQFHDFRMALQQMLAEGFRSESKKKKTDELKYLEDAIRTFSNDSMVRKDKAEKTKYLIRPDLSDTYCNYLYGAFSLCSVRNSRAATYPVMVMQMLAGSREGRTCNSLETQMMDIISRDRKRDTKQETAQEKLFDAKNIKLGAAVNQLLQRGMIEPVPNDREKKLYRLAPAFPMGLPKDSEEQQLQRLQTLHMLLSLLSERLMPQTLGYHCRATLELLLAQFGVDPEQIRRPAVIKRDARPRLMVDDEILWSLLTAHVRRKRVQLKFLNFNNVPVLSVALQPLFVKTYPGEGRHYLVARQPDSPEQASTRPVILPLDRIIQVHILAADQEWSQEESRSYIEQWFAHSFSGLSPALQDFDGNPAAPQQVLVYREVPADEKDPDAWLNRHRAERRCVGVEAVSDSVYRFEYLLTRPEDLEHLLLADPTVTEVGSPGSDFALRFRERRRLLQIYGTIPPCPRTEVIYPPLQKDPEPMEDDDEMGLFSSWYNRQLRNTIANVNSWLRGSDGFGWKDGLAPDSNTSRYQTLNTDMCEAMCFAEDVTQGRSVRTKYTPYFSACVPARFTYPEMDWLERFLADSYVRAILGSAYCDRLQGYLRERLELGNQLGLYRRRFEGQNFLQLNSWGQYNRNRAGLDEIPLAELFDALINHRLIDFDHHTATGTVIPSRNILPVRLEYMPGAERLRMMLYDPASEKFFFARCVNMKQLKLHPQALPQEVWQQWDQTLEDYLKSVRKTRTLIVYNEPNFLRRVYGVLQPYLDTICTDADGTVRITLNYCEFEKYHLSKILGLLFPGAAPEEAPEELPAT